MAPPAVQRSRTLPIAAERRASIPRLGEAGLRECPVGAAVAIRLSFGVPIRNHSVRADTHPLVYMPERNGSEAVGVNECEQRQYTSWHSSTALYGPRRSSRTAITAVARLAPPVFSDRGNAVDHRGPAARDRIMAGIRGAPPCAASRALRIPIQRHRDLQQRRLAGRRQPGRRTHPEPVARPALRPVDSRPAVPDAGLRDPRRRGRAIIPILVALKTHAEVRGRVMGLFHPRNEHDELDGGRCRAVPHLRRAAAMGSLCLLHRRRGARSCGRRAGLGGCRTRSARRTPWRNWRPSRPASARSWTRSCTAILTSRSRTISASVRARWKSIARASWRNSRSANRPWPSGSRPPQPSPTDRNP